MAKIIIAGGAGRLGRLLANRYSNEKVVVLTRSLLPKYPNTNVRYVHWNGVDLGAWASELEDADTVINLSGKSIDCRFNNRNKEVILHSRTRSTSAIGKAISQCDVPPKLWINAGGISIYPNSEELFDESDSPYVDGFLALVSEQWEAAFEQYDTPTTRKVLLRIAAVLQRDEGMLKPLVKLAKFGLGGYIGSGEQYISWIHETDFVRLVDWAIENENSQGVVHASSPDPIRNKDFMKAIRHKVGIPFGIPNPEWSTKLGAWLIGTEAELVLSGRRVVSKVLAENGFEFQYPEFGDALRDLI